MHTRVHAHMHAHACTNTHACTHARTHTHTHTHTHSLPPLLTSGGGKWGEGGSKTLFLQTHSGFGLQVKTRDETIVRQRAESEELLQNIRSLKEELAEKEGQLRSLQLDLQSAKKQIQHQSQEVGVLGREEDGRRWRERDVEGEELGEIVD